MNSGGSSVVFGTNEMSLDVYNLDWDVTVGVSHTAVEDDRVGGLRDWAQNAGQRFQQHMDYLCFDALNKGDVANSAYGVGYDKQPLFSASHVDPQASFQTAQSNLLTTALDMNNYEALQIAASNLRDDRGQPTGLSYPILIVPPSLQRVASQITGNDWVFSTPNREINPYAAMTRLLVAPGGYLDTTAWYAVSDDLSSKPIILQIRQMPKLLTWDDYSDGAGVRYYKWVARYNVAYGNWRTVFQGNT
jgi:phage major head subunit gpT-like protein